MNLTRRRSRHNDRVLLTLACAAGLVLAAVVAVLFQRSGTGKPGPADTKQYSDAV
jgi:hypothetical protein